MSGPGRLPDEQDEAGWTAALRAMPQEVAPVGFAVRLEARLRDAEVRRQALVRTLFMALVAVVAGSAATLAVAYVESATVVAALTNAVLALGFIGKAALAVARYAPGVAGTVVLAQCVLFAVGFGSLIAIFRRFAARPPGLMQTATDAV